jgi:hypothetical protein
VIGDIWSEPEISINGEAARVTNEKLFSGQELVSTFGKEGKHSWMRITFSCLLGRMEDRDI